jgi:hypothetical protein
MVMPRATTQVCSVRATNRRETVDFEVPTAAPSISAPTGSSSAW